jgi:hypothetical protein
VTNFGAAAAIEERLGAPLLLARTHAGWARALIARFPARLFHKAVCENLGCARCDGR